MECYTSGEGGADDYGRKVDEDDGDYKDLDGEN